MPNYVTNLQTNFESNYNFDVSTTYNLPNTIGTKTITFTLQDDPTTGKDGNIDYIRLYLGDTSIYYDNSNAARWWVNGNKSYTITSQTYVSDGTDAELVSNYQVQTFIDGVSESLDLKLLFHFEDGNMQWFTLTTFTFLAPLAVGLRADSSNVKKLFYLGEPFNYDNLRVYCQYQKQVSGVRFENQVTNYRVSANTSSLGNNFAMITFAGESAYYNFTVYGVSSYSFGTLSKTNLKKSIDTLTSILPSTLTITYENGDEETQDIDINNVVSAPDLTTTGDKQFTLKATTIKTNEEISTEYAIKVIDVSSIAVTTNPTKLIYNSGDSLNLDGLVVMADFGSAGALDVTNDVTASGYNASKVGKQAVTLTYRSVTTTFDVYVSGLYSASVDLSLVNSDSSTAPFYRETYLFGYLPNVQSNINNILSKIRVSYVKRTYTAVNTYNDSSHTADNNEIAIASHTLVKGDNTYSVSLTKNSVTLNCTFNIKTYKYESLEIRNYREYVYYDVNNTLSLDGVSVYGFDDDDDTFTLLNADEYTINLADEYEYPLGDTTVTFTALTNGSTGSVVVHCVEDAPTESATLTIEGSLNKTAISNKYYYDKGETIGLNNLILIVNGTLSGTPITLTSEEYDKELFRMVSNEKVVHDGLTFTDDDATGDYTLRLSFGTLYVDYTVSLYYATAVTLNTSTSQTLYKCGEKLNFTHIKGLITLNSGEQRQIVEDDIVQFEKTFEKSDLTDYDTETEELQFTIAGITNNDTKMTFTIICIKSMAVTLSNSNYNIHDELSVASVQVVYSNDTQENQNRRNLTTREIESIEWSFDITDLNPTGIRSTNAFTLESSFTEGGVTVETSNNITIKALKEIRIVDSTSSQFATITANYNDRVIDVLDDYYLYPVFNDNLTLGRIAIDNTTKIRAGAEIINQNIIKTSIDDAFINFKWLDNQDREIDNLDGVFDIFCNTLSKIELEWNGLDDTHYVGETISLSEVSDIVATFNEDDETYEYEDDTLTYTDLTFSINNMPINDYTYTFNAEGTYTITATYTFNGLPRTATLSFSVEEVELLDLTITYTGNTSYKEEQTMNVSDSTLTIVGVYNDSGTLSDNYPKITFSKVQFYEKVNDEYVLFNINKQLQVSDNGKTLYVGYNGVYAKLMGNSTTLSVTAKTLTSINVLQNPTKTTYTIGDLFSLKGIEVQANFDNGKTDKIYYQNTNLTFSGISSSRLDSTDITQNETIDVTVSYTYGSVTESKDIRINLALPVLTSLRIVTTNASTIFADGGTFSPSGITVYGVFENGYETELSTTYYTIDTSAFISNYPTNTTISVPNISGTNRKQYGLYVIPVTADNPFDAEQESVTNDTDYKITITGSAAIEQSYLQFDTDVDWEHYVVGEKFTAKGVHFWVIDGDGNEYEVSFYTNPVINTIFKSSQKLEVTAYYSTIASQTFTIYIDVAYSSNLTTTTDYKIAIGDKDGLLFEEVVYKEATIKLGLLENGERIYPIFKASDVTIDTNESHSDTYGYNVLTDSSTNASSKCIGYMNMGLQDMYGNVIKNAHIVLFEDYANPIAGDGNVTVKYPHYVKGYADRINKCKFGIIFNKHLFVSGNEEYKNCDWHTESINIGQLENYNQIAESDYTYFSDLDYCYYGTDDTKVLGYDIYRDGDLVVIKESSRTQATLYRREAKMITAIDSQGNTIEGYYEDAYPSFDINSNGGDGGLSNRSIINFMGDTLFLTKNGLKVLSSKDTTYNKEKIVYDVSSYINQRIINENLEDGYLYTFKEKLLLRTSRGLYIGEYMLRNENKEYEWYFLDNINADLFFEYDDELYFMNDNGEFSKFSYNEKLYEDNSRVFIGVGGTLLTNIENDGDGFDFDASTNKIIISNEYADSVKEGKDFHLITVANDTESLVHASLGSFIETNEYNNNQNTYTRDDYIGEIDSTNNIIEIKPYKNGVADTLLKMQINDMFDENKTIYIDLISDSQVAVANQPLVDKAYKLQKVSDNVFNYKYKLVDKNGIICNLSQVKSFRLSYIVNELKNTTITNVEPYGDGKQFQLLGEYDKIIDLIDYDNRQNRYSAVITNKDNVKSFFITRPYDFGTILYEKTVWQWAIANDTELASYMDVGYLTSKKQSDYTLVVKTASGSKTYNYDDNNFSFEKIQFTSDKLPHIYNRFRVLYGIGFIRFIFKNFESSNMVLDKLSLIYTISQSIKGVK